MASVTQIVGDDGSNVLSGTPGDDLIYGYDLNGPQSQVNTISATLIATADTPVFVCTPPGDLDQLFIIEKGGQIEILDLQTGQIEPTPFLDLSSQVQTDGEEGLLGLAFDPNYAQNCYFYVDMIDSNGDTEIRRYQVSQGDPNVANPASSTLILSVDQPAGSATHKAGWLGFGPDGDLYIAVGDGGTGGDPAQDPDSLLGKILRIDVSTDAFPGDPTRNYAIPADNPFVGSGGAEEVWALGLRNPWRDSFDRALGAFYIADVGQNLWEEIDLGAAGANYGWNNIEGPRPYLGGTPTIGTLTAPIHFYSHRVGDAIAGGYVYRGPSEALQGQYFFGDYVDGKIWTLQLVHGNWVATERTDQIVYDTGTVQNPASFGEDGLDNLYVVDVGNGGIYRLDPQYDSADQGDMLSGGGGNDFIYGGGGNDQISGGTGNNSLYGMDGDDPISLNDGLDIADGGAGTDRLIIDYSDATSAFNAAITSGTLATGFAGFVSDGAGNVTKFANIENLTITVGSGDDAIILAGGTNVINGGGGHDHLTGGTGDDVLTGGPGADDLDGGGGNDTASYALSLQAVDVSLQSGLGANGDAAGDTLVRIENLIGSANDDTLTADGGANILTGGAGADHLVGGGDSDTASYAGSGQAVDVDLGTGAAAGGDAAGDTFSSIENLVGSGNADTLTGDDNPNRLDGGPGADILTGASGNDTYVVDNPGDRVVEAANTDPNDTVESSIDFTLPANIETLVLTGDAVLGIGNSLVNHIFGNIGDNILYGGGNDILAGGFGDDTYSLASAGDQVVELAGEGRDAVYVPFDNYVLPTNAETLVLFGDVVTGSGNSGDNFLYGNDLDNFLFDGGGTDVLYGREGNDTYYVTNSNAEVVENPGEGRDTVYSRVNFALPANVENLVLTGNAVVGTGNSLDNYIYGDSLNNVLRGCGGADSMFGGADNDTYFVTSHMAAVVEDPDAGFDSVYFSGKSFALPDNVENLHLTGHAMTGIGSDLNNRVFGDNVDNVLDGGGGHDLLKGGGGDDVFIFNAGEANGDAIADFTGQGPVAADMLEFVGYGTAEDGASFVQLDSTHWQINSADGLTNEVITLRNGAAVDQNDYIFT